MRVANMGTVQDNNECGGKDNYSDEITLEYESGGGSSEIMNSQEFWASTSIGIYRKMMCIDTATLFLREEDSILSDEKESVRVGFAETDGEAYLEFELEAKSCRGRFGDIVMATYRVYYEITEINRD